MKHRLYGSKFDFPVLPNRLCIRTPNHDLEGISDLTFLRNFLRLHKKLIAKLESEYELSDVGNMLEECPSMWGVLVDE